MTWRSSEDEEEELGAALSADATMPFYSKMMAGHVSDGFYNLVHLLTVAKGGKRRTH